MDKIIERLNEIRDEKAAIKSQLEEVTKELSQLKAQNKLLCVEKCSYEIKNKNLQNIIDRLKKEVEKYEETITRMNKENNSLFEEIRLLNKSAYGEKLQHIKLYRDEYILIKRKCEEKDKIIDDLTTKLGKIKNNTSSKDENTDGVRSLVEHLIEYAEREDKNVAREIKIALNAKMANGCIASNVLTDEWKQRLEDLGRDKTRNNNLNFNNQVGTVVAHADHVTITTGEHE